MSRTTKYLDDDDSPFDERGVLKDGRSTRVSMRMRDSLSRRRRTIRDASLVTDANGDGGLALRRPGYRVQVADHIAAVVKQEARDAYQNELTNAWRKPKMRDDNGYGSGEFSGAQEGDVCTVRNSRYPNAQGAPGHLRMQGGRLVCVPDSSSRSDSRSSVRDARQAYDARIREAWRQGK